MPQMFGAKSRKPFRIRRIGFRGNEATAGVSFGLLFYDTFDHSEPVAQALAFADTFDYAFTVGDLVFYDGFEE